MPCRHPRQAARGGNLFRREVPGRRIAGGSLAVATGEFLNSTRGIDKLLLAGEERMAGGANADSHVLSRRARGVNRAAGGAINGGFVVVGMDVGLHGRRGFTGFGQRLVGGQNNENSPLRK